MSVFSSLTRSIITLSVFFFSSFNDNTIGPPSVALTLALLSAPSLCLPFLPPCLPASLPVAESVSPTRPSIHPSFLPRNALFYPSVVGVVVSVLSVLAEDTHVHHGWLDGGMDGGHTTHVVAVMFSLLHNVTSPNLFLCRRPACLPAFSALPSLPCLACLHPGRGLID
uniref:Uncharacterized protein n=1 Tax=Vitrella brassicaformis TaxID=1169539 RepID=A0A7S1KCQ2_9ALVE|mmetsp:Transcript_45836/g.113924  ORF Transcript_45836/g.113924 Transcript_45836/m.113924 type:complete len:168 (+) Transcript_45836:899-1402(+)